jgi:hypothetical protein
MDSSLNKRFVRIGLWLTLANLVLAVVVANAYPFEVGDAWSNTLLLTLVPCIGIWSSVLVFVTQHRLNNIMRKLIETLAISLVFGAILIGVFVFVENSDNAVSLLVGAYGINLFAHIVSSALIYLRTPIGELRDREHNVTFWGRSAA